MHALAEFIMRGRLQAGTVAVLGYLIPLLAPAAVALVTLRKGAAEGSMMVLFGLSPALLSLVLGDGSSVVVWITWLSLMVVYVPALILRSTISLSMMVMSAMMTAAAVTLAVLLFAPDSVTKLVDSLVGQLMVLEGGELGDSQEPLSTLVSQSGVSGMIGYVLAFNSVVGVLLGRWLQSLVVNPGGFGSEFRELRLSVGVATLCFLASVLLRYQGDEYWWWSNIFAIPLVLVAIAVAHDVAKCKQLAMPWLILFYLSALIFMPIIMCVGFIDTWINFRNRLRQQ
jgi:hypothetical protein